MTEETVPADGETPEATEGTTEAPEAPAAEVPEAPGTAPVIEETEEERLTRVFDDGAAKRG